MRALSLAATNLQRLRHKLPGMARARLAGSATALFCLALGVLAVGCGPVYSTLTDYEPPADPVARAGLANCELIRSQCLQIEERSAEDCQRTANARFDECSAKVKDCEQAAEAEYQKCSANGKFCSRRTCINMCIRGSCSVDEARCKSQYDRCYSSAGGKVSTRTVCVKRCDGVAAPQEPVSPRSSAAGETRTDERSRPPAEALQASPVAGKQTDDDCLGSEQCEKFGRCSAKQGVCVAANNASCKQSLNCKLLKKCTAKAGECVR